MVIPDTHSIAEAPRLLPVDVVGTILNVSRPYVVKLADAGKLGSIEKTAEGIRLIPADAVDTYRRERRIQARAALNELGAIQQK